MRKQSVSAAILASALLVLAAFSFVVPVGAVVFPACSSSTTLQVFPTWRDAADPAGAFGVAGCVYPYGTSVAVSFTTASGASIPGLPTLTLPSRTTDGHFHTDLQTPKFSDVGNGAMKVYAKNLATGETVGSWSGVQLQWVRPFCQPGTLCVDATTRMPAPRQAPFVYPAFAQGPAGAVTFFLRTLTVPAHAHVYFANWATNAPIAGLPNASRPMDVYIPDDHSYFVSFVIPTRVGLDKTVFNINAFLTDDEDCGTTCAPQVGMAIFPLWVHSQVGSQAMTTTTSTSTSSSTSTSTASPSFSLTASQTSLSLVHGTTGTVTLTTTSLNGFAGTVGLGTSANIPISLSPTVFALTAGSSVVSTLQVFSSTAGSYMVTVTARSGTSSQRVTIFVTVT